MNLQAPFLPQAQCCSHVFRYNYVLQKNKHMHPLLAIWKLNILEPFLLVKRNERGLMICQSLADAMPWKANLKSLKMDTNLTTPVSQVFLSGNRFICTCLTVTDVSLSSAVFCEVVDLHLWVFFLLCLDCPQACSLTDATMPRNSPWNFIYPPEAVILKIKPLIFLLPYKHNNAIQ